MPQNKNDELPDIGYPPKYNSKEEWLNDLGHPDDDPDIESEEYQNDTVDIAKMFGIDLDEVIEFDKKEHPENYKDEDKDKEK